MVSQSRCNSGCSGFVVRGAPDRNRTRIRDSRRSPVLSIELRRRFGPARYTGWLHCSGRSAATMPKRAALQTSLVDVRPAGPSQVATRRVKLPSPAIVPDLKRAPAVGYEALSDLAAGFCLRKVLRNVGLAGMAGNLRRGARPEIEVRDRLPRTLGGISTFAAPKHHEGRGTACVPGLA